MKRTKLTPKNAIAIYIHTSRAKGDINEKRLGGLGCGGTNRIEIPRFKNWNQTISN